MFGGDLLGNRTGFHRPIVVAFRELPERPPHGRAKRHVHFHAAELGKVPDGSHADALQFCLRDRADAPKFAHRQRVEQFVFPRAGYHKHPVGFCLPGGNFGVLFTGPGPDGGGQSGFFPNQPPQPFSPLPHLIFGGTDERSGLHERLVHG